MRFWILICTFGSLTCLALADPLWFRTYNGPYYSLDEVQAIGVDDSGNVIVSGSSRVGRNDEEFVTIKYRPNGDTVWLRRFNPGSGLDGATALAVDRAGNIIVTGYLGYATSEYGDWVTIKYSAAGDSLWTAVYDLGNQDRPSSIAVDWAGNIYVTGQAGWSNNLEYVVVKYDSNGNEVWEFSYDGGDDDRAWALAVDGESNTYVTGWTRISSGERSLMTWKLGPGGESLWVNVYTGPSGTTLEGWAIATDSQGNVIVAGRIYDNITRAEDYLTVKYGPTGDTLWTRRYNGPNNLGEEVAGLALDAAGNVYVTGTSYVDTLQRRNFATVKYSPDGEQRWVVRYRGYHQREKAVGLALDAYANVYVTGFGLNLAGYWSAVTVKYDSAGNQQWIELFTSVFREAEAFVITVSPQVMVYVGGRTDTDTTSFDYLVLAYGSVGALTETPGAEVQVPAAEPTIVRGQLRLPMGNSQAPVVLLDATGRRVMELCPGVNDIRQLAPGVYFVRQVSGEGCDKLGSCKVTVTR